MFYLGRIKKIIWRAWHRATQHMKSLLLFPLAAQNVRASEMGVPSNSFETRNKAPLEQSSMSRSARSRQEQLSVIRNSSPTITSNWLGFLWAVVLVTPAWLTAHQNSLHPQPRVASHAAAPGWKVTVTPLAQLHVERAIPVKSFSSAWTSHWISLLKYAVALKD